jgi:hypothetical protein
MDPILDSLAEFCHDPFVRDLPGDIVTAARQRLTDAPRMRARLL